MKARLIVSLVLILWSAHGAAAEPSLGPVIEGYGPTFPINDRDVALETGAVYKAVFDIGAYADDLNTINYRLVSVARYLNMHARNGVGVENMDLVVVIHGRAIHNLMRDDAYQLRHGINNPNLELLTRLHEAGVAIYICGQSMGFNGVKKSELVGETQVALSAMTMLTVLQNSGYALLP